MVTRETLSQKREQILRIAQENGVSDIRVFGSVARGDTKETSDVDLVVKLAPGRSLLDLGGFQYFTQELLGVRVDVVTDDGLRPRMRERVLREAVPL
jgi:uncharacterized protein